VASLTENAVVLILANALKYLVGFILPMVLVRLLSRNDYGTYQQLTLLANFGTGVMLLGLPLSVYYFYRRAHRPTLIAQTQILLVVTGGVSAAAIVVFAPRIAAQMHNPELLPLLPLYAAFVGLNIFGELSMHVMINQSRYRLELGLELAETVFRVGSLVSLVLLGYALHAMVLALILYAFLRLAVRSYWLLTGPDSLRLASWSERFPRRQLGYSLPLAASTCVGLVGGLLDKMIVALFFSPGDYAIYSVGALEVPLDTIFQGSVASVLRASLPGLIADGRLDEVVRIWRESVRKLALIMIPSFIFLTFFAQRLITTLFTQRYHASVDVFRVYMLVLPLYMFILNAVPQVFGKTKLNLYVAAVTVTSNAVFSLVLLHFIGMLGPAVAFVCSSYLASGIYFVVTTRLLKTGFLQLLPFQPLGRTALAACLAAAPTALVASRMQGVSSLAAGALIFTLGYAVAGYLVGAFRPADLAIARSWLRRLVPSAAAR
jgi:O-antigen/teichoic acid export membrane protein